MLVDLSDLTLYLYDSRADISLLAAVLYFELSTKEEQPVRMLLQTFLIFEQNLEPTSVHFHMSDL
jgi:hypothetical protein